jgi:FtsP/CotA-like multicopper oxidase with cupredoxin domain
MKSIALAVVTLIAAYAITTADPSPNHQAQPPTKAVEPSAREKAATALRAKWDAFLKNRDKAVQTAEAHAKEDQPEDKIAPPRRRSEALKAQFPIADPPIIRTGRGGVLRTNLVIDYADHTIGTDPVRLRSYNGRLTGPTLRVRPGDTLRIVLDNRLPADAPYTGPMNTFHGPNTTNLHTHGLHVSPAGNSDNVMLEINGGQQFEYEIKIPEDHPAGTFWYHAHKHGSVSLQVASGLAGALIVEGGMDELPSIEAMVERTFVLQQIPYIIPTGEKVGVVEPEYADQMFGPTDWQTLGRYTTINGRVQPVIFLRPGEIQRWRFVMAGIRETVNLQLVPAAGNGAPVQVNQIAADGLALGMVGEQPQIPLWAGYRADLLVTVPAAGEYLLIDAATAAPLSLNGVPKPTKYLAKVVVGGPQVKMAMPTDIELARFRLPSLPAGKFDGTQSATYSLGGGKFAINGQSYDPTKARHLKLGATDQWTVKTADVAHVFHIHVNPFEVVSIKDATGKETLTHPIWHDTVVLLPNQTVTFNTNYKRYIGEFVQHCHILDHEDQGMMEQIIIDPPGGLMNHLMGDAMPKQNGKH